MYFLHFFQTRNVEILDAIQGGNRQQGRDQKRRSPLICVRQTRVNSLDELRIGDHLVFHRVLYDHHGIITQKGVEGYFQVIEAGKANLKKSWKKVNFQRDNVSVVDYTQRLSHPQTASLAHDEYTKSKKVPKLYKYNLFTNNCEHFATYCATRNRYSLQVADFGSRSLPSYIQARLELLKKRGNTEQSTYYICIQCENIENENDVKNGDIIEYFEKGIRHHAVVIDTIRPTSQTVHCSVAHCNSCDTLSGKKIKKEDIVITFNTLFYKLNFESSGCDIYEPAVVVRNTVEENFRKMAESLTDACSRFPIWCKLKL